MLGEEAAGGHRSKHPQPVLDPLPGDLYEGSIADADATRRNSHNHHRADPATQAINGHTAADVSPAEHFVQPAQFAHANGRGTAMDKPKFQRARSDFGPRNERRHSDDNPGHHSPLSPPPEESAKFKMRHGWEAQLQSDEQANLLSQVHQTLHIYYAAAPPY